MQRAEDSTLQRQRLADLFQSLLNTLDDMNVDRWRLARDLIFEDERRRIARIIFADRNAQPLGMQIREIGKGRLVGERQEEEERPQQLERGRAALARSRDCPPPASP